VYALIKIFLKKNFVNWFYCCILALMALEGVNIDDIKDFKDSYDDFKDSFQNFGVTGLLGHYFSNEFNENNPKFNLDFPRGRFNFSPNKKWNFYMEPDSIKTNKLIPEFGGLRIGGTYNF
jgi:hypothetical protein